MCAGGFVPQPPQPPVFGRALAAPPPPPPPPGGAAPPPPCALAAPPPPPPPPGGAAPVPPQPPVFGSALAAPPPPPPPPGGAASPPPPQPGRRRGYAMPASPPQLSNTYAMPPPQHILQPLGMALPTLSFGFAPSLAFAPPPPPPPPPPASAGRFQPPPPPPPPPAAPIASTTGSRGGRGGTVKSRAELKAVHVATKMTADHFPDQPQAGERFFTQISLQKRKPAVELKASSLIREAREMSAPSAQAVRQLSSLESVADEPRLQSAQVRLAEPVVLEKAAGSSVLKKSMAELLCFRAARKSAPILGSLAVEQEEERTASPAAGAVRHKKCVRDGREQDSRMLLPITSLSVEENKGIKDRLVKRCMRRGKVSEEASTCMSMEVDYYAHKQQNVKRSSEMKKDAASQEVEFGQDRCSRWEVEEDFLLRRQAWQESERRVESLTQKLDYGGGGVGMELPVCLKLHLGDLLDVVRSNQDRLLHLVKVQICLSVDWGHTHLHIYLNILNHTHKYARAYTHPDTCACAHTHTRTHARMHTRVRAYTHTHTHTRTRTHKHMHARMRVCTLER